MDDRAEPLDDGSLVLDRAGRGAVDDEAQARDVVRGARRLRKGEEPTEHGRHAVGVRHPMFVDQPQHLFGVPLLHQDRRDARVHRNRQAEMDRTGVVQGARRQGGVVAFRLETEHSRKQLHSFDGFRRIGHGTADPLGTPRRAGRVQHGVAEDWFVDVACVVGRHGALEIDEAVERTADRAAKSERGGFPGLDGTVRELGIGE